jgi:hypothetical protein
MIIETIVQLHDLEMEQATETAAAWHEIYEALAKAASGIDLEANLSRACDAEYELTGDTAVCGRLETLLVGAPSDHFSWRGTEGSATFQQLGLLPNDDPESINVSFTDVDANGNESRQVVRFTKVHDYGVSVEYADAKNVYRIRLKSKYRVI